MKIYLPIIYCSLLIAVACDRPDPKVVAKGKELYVTYCVLCHGDTALGDGRLSVNKMPKPANLTKSNLTKKQLYAIIADGGASVGRSPFMPPWKEELGKEKIDTLIEYLMTLRKK